MIGDERGKMSSMELEVATGSRAVGVKPAKTSNDKKGPCLVFAVVLSCILGMAILAVGGYNAYYIRELVQEEERRAMPLEPPIPGIMPGKERPKIILAQDVDWPPYAYVAVPPEGDFEVAGFGHDIAKGLQSVCDVEVVTRQTQWSECWGSNKIGAGLDNGAFHGCMTYTHTAGTRNRYLDFSRGILDANKPAGILTRLGSDGKPAIDPTSDLSGKRIVDVSGWAPTADGLSLVNNHCSGARFSDFTVLTPSESGNDAAMRMLRDGDADGMFVYADQAYNYRPNQDGVTPTWDTALWTGLGSEFAYIHTGMFGHAYNGTTLAISKKGSGLNAILNPCIEAFMQTRAYYEVCHNHSLTSSCFRNAHFPAALTAETPWMLPTNEQSGPCSTGYCACDVGVTSDVGSGA